MSDHRALSRTAWCDCADRRSDWADLNRGGFGWFLLESTDLKQKSRTSSPERLAAVSGTLSQGGFITTLGCPITKDN